MPKTVQEILNASEIEAHRAWVLEATDDQLDEYVLRTSGNETLNRLGLAERSKRQFKHLKKPHWTLTPGFWVAFSAMVFAAIAAWPVIREWIQSAAPASKVSSFQAPQSNSAPATPTIKQIAPPATNAAQGTNLLKK